MVMPGPKGVPASIAAARKRLNTADANRVLADQMQLWSKLPDNQVQFVRNEQEVEFGARVGGEFHASGLKFDIGIRGRSTVETANAEVKEAAAELAEAKRTERERWGRAASIWSSVVLVTAAMLCIAAWWWGWGSPKSHSDVHGDRQYVALAWSGPITVLMLLVLGFGFVGWQRGSVLGLIVGKDNRYSTSLVQVALWTLAVVFAFVMFIMQIAQDVDLGDDKGFGGFDETYLFLLGGPFAAALLAKFAATRKTDDNTVQQSVADTPSSKDVVSDHSGATSLTDAQFLLFNLVAVGYFAVGFGNDPTTLPYIEPTLVGLTSLSALTYVGGKVVNSNPPSITSISIISEGENGKLKPGVTMLRILGKNFQPSGSAVARDLQTAVLFGVVEVSDLEIASDSELRTLVPIGLPAGPIDISVRTSEGVMATPWKGFEVT